MWRYFSVGVAVHAVAALVFAGVTRLRLEGCDLSDGLAASLAVAVAVDLVVAAVVAWVSRPRDPGRRRAAGYGWGLSYVVAMVAACAVLQYVNGLPSGCVGS